MPDTMIQPDEGQSASSPRYQRRSAEFDKLAAALAKAQGAMENAERSAENPAFKRDGAASTYATLASVWSAIRKPLTDNGLSVLQWPRTLQGGIEIETELMHESGQFMRDILWLPCQMTVHAVGSAITYGRRYALMAIVGIAPEDDDGNAAVDAHKPGPAGSASGGTDFRPPGPRRTGWAKEAENDGTLDTTRNKGEMPGKAPPANGKKSAAEKAKSWTDTAIATIKLPGQHVASLDKWWKDQQAVPSGAKFSPLGWLEEAAPDEYERLQAAFDEVRSNAQQVAA